MVANEKHRRVFVRYWGSHFKFRDQVALFASEFRALIARGWECYLVLDHAPENPEWLRELEELGVQLEYLPRPRSNFDWPCIRRVARFLRRIRASVVRCDNFHTTAMLAGFLARVPVRVWVKGSMSSCYENCRVPTWRDKFAPSVRLSCALASQVVAVSAAVRDELIGLGISRSRIIVRHLPRRLGKVSSLNRNECRAQFGLNGDGPVVVAVGHAVAVKGWDVLLRAFEIVSKKFSATRLLLVGSNNIGAEKICHAELAEFVRGHHLGDKVIFTGHIDDVRPALRAADVFAMPSRSEGFCYALIEALEAGLPVVASRVGVAPDVIRDGVNGLLVERGDPQQMSDALARLLGDSTLRNRLAENSSVPASIPTLPEYADQLASDYEALLAAR
jgi:glycosyltransferase involved in cell wall biosynthesis